jgi:ABC-2 type transport system ATP-binding protein
MTNAVQMKDLTKRHRGFRLGGITMDVPAGCVTGIFGPNGAGKSTLVKLIARHMRPTSGSLTVLGRSYDEDEKELRRRVTFVAEEPPFYPEKTVGWTGRFLADFYDDWDQTRFSDLLHESRIDADREIKHLSRGQKTPFALAAAFAHGADLLVLDEPLNGLDILHRQEVLRRIREFASDDGKAAIVSSHVTDALGDIADHVAFLREGRLALFEERDALLSRWKLVHFRKGSLPQDVASTLLRVEEHALGCSGYASDFAALRDGLEPLIASGAVRVENAGLDGVLVALVKGGN